MDTLIFLVTVFFLISLILLIFFVYVPRQQFKNKTKSLAKEEAESAREMFENTASFELHTGGINRSARCYKAFIDTQIMEGKINLR